MGRLAAFLMIAILALLMERMLRTFELALSSDKVLLDIARMIVNLMPHYLGVAMPLVFFLALLLTVNRFSREDELVIMHNAGLGLQSLLRPIMVLTFFLTALSFVTVSVLQPTTRYNFRAVVHEITHKSPAASSKAGTFFKAGDYIFVADRRFSPGQQFEGVFLFSEKDDGKQTVTTARYGVLQKSAARNESILTLQDGEQTIFSPDGSPPQQLQFDRFGITLFTGENIGFRPRGKDARELTLPELFLLWKNPPKQIPENQIGANIHFRLVQVMTLLILPLLAIPLGLSAGRSSQVSGMALGLMTLIAYEKVLQIGKALGTAGSIPTWSGAWIPWFCLLAFSAYLFFPLIHRVHEPPLAAFSRRMDEIGSLLARKFPRRRLSKASSGVASDVSGNVSGGTG